jgi:hypothetical protein
MLPVYARADLIARLDQFLPPEGPLIFQSSSGSSRGTILRIPRRVTDIQDIFARTLVPYCRVFGHAPARIAMLGGSSHAEAALKFRLESTAFDSFGRGEGARLMAFNPEVISCYPSIARELAADAKLVFPALRAFKLGGEQLFPTDLAKLRNRFGDVAIFEQVGSTEMPCLAIGLREINSPRSLPLQTQRFRFRLGQTRDWQRLIVRDEFPDLLYPFDDFYDTEDEVKTDGTNLFDIRRANDPATAYFGLQDELLAKGATNVQIALRTASIHIDIPHPKACLMPKKINWGNETFSISINGLLFRNSANKLPLLGG